ncbi:cytochrome P450 alkane hydroxylase [Metarhizium album ARSEF 1941]|uniref:Cytochrome P450 alkane hydroxylase n=1 Tax=Metarhizium album (strain ARSEF 1941) TaxID=1081103 RepID=A0A0B2WMW7_METAS|nr:cytochrome P450 alkane hydroxylase [Metarhizium album ARSEF 1941]KHN97416.1 cytochrome P450 alkane hydroxylase [Metarhizium album ARSEF 1941]
MQANNRMLEHFDSIFSKQDPKCPNVVELQLGRRRVIVTRDPEHIKTVLTSKFTHYGKGRLVHSAASPFLGDSIFTTDGQLWQKSRALIRPMFKRERVRDIEIFSRWTDVFISKLPPSGSTVDICDLFYRMTLDASTDFLLGQSVGALDHPNGEFSRAFTNVQRMQMIRVILYSFRHVLPLRQYYDGIKVIERFITPYIESTLRLSIEELEHLSKSDKGFTFLHNIALFSRDPQVIRDQVFAVLIAGRDTTAATLSWAIYELANHPEVWQKLRKQVLERVGPTRAPSYEDLKNLMYLTHTINETLRLYPAVPYNIRGCLEDSTLPTPEGRSEIATSTNDIVIYSTMAMQRRPDLYPSVSDSFADPAIFSPDRWEHWTPKPWQYVPFNGGPRICIGQNFAVTEMAFTLVRLLQKYDRVEYRGDWNAQFHKAELVGCPGQGVPVALYEAKD